MREIFPNGAVLLEVKLHHYPPLTLDFPFPIVLLIKPRGNQFSR
jgi:hypothetical protein